MSASEADTIWISNSAIKKPTDIVAKAMIFAERDNSLGSVDGRA
jgi:hypothetical protein